MGAADVSKGIGAWSRRALLAGLAALPFAAQPVHARKKMGGGGSAPTRSLVDAHCHLFNVTDIPVARFAQVAILDVYDHPGPPAAWEAALALLLRKIANRVASGVITAKIEAELPQGSRSLSDIAPLDEKALDEDARKADRELARGRRTEALRAGPDCESEAPLSPSVRSIATWLRSLRSSRAEMTRELVRDNLGAGHSTVLLCPALVDYSNWLNAELKSSLCDQIDLHKRLSRDSAVPVHGYVAFDPLRQALRDVGHPTVDGDWDPLAQVRRALETCGFAGIKIYPPMGFRPSGNAASGQGYQPRVIDAFGTAQAAGAALDAALERLWDLAIELDAPIMAHAANGNAAGRGFGRRADPTFWLPVLEKHPRLRVMLAHFGRFKTYAHGHEPRPDCRGVPFDETWEAVVGRTIEANPDCGLYADISFLADIYTPRERAISLAGMKAYRSHDTDGRHLVYGSDWAMMGINKHYRRRGGYPARVREFLVECGFGDDAIEGIMHRNALRFLGLGAQDRSRERLLRFYADNGLPHDRLPLADPRPA